MIRLDTLDGSEPELMKSDKSTGCFVFLCVWKTKESSVRRSKGMFPLERESRK